MFSRRKYSGYSPEQCPSPEKGQDGVFESGFAALENPAFPLFSDVEDNCEAGLSSYFETSMRKKWTRRHYIDLFAGPGKCVCRKTGTVYLGSPLLALTTKYPFTDYVFVDSDPENIVALQERGEALSASARIQFIVDDANRVAEEIVQRLHRAPSLNLAFLDPDGLEELRWKTVATLAKIERLDLIIHYSQMGLTRTMPQAYESEGETIVDSFFGDREWRKIYGEYCRKEESFLHRQLMDHYKSKLKELGYKETYRDDEVGAEPLMRNEKNAPLYRLLFASKHPLGLKFWEKVISRDAHGQRRLF
ncbi:MAG: three-Cys-motif partner protein TcmP [Anaerolineae bacterium]|nr:three-Cys-motif partner protein TcmP [Anaerolineae bacterium]